MESIINGDPDVYRETNDVVVRFCNYALYLDFVFILAGIATQETILDSACIIVKGMIDLKFSSQEVVRFDRVPLSGREQLNIKIIISSY
ncbi:Uncharacterised protein [marine metagenome]